MKISSCPGSKTGCIGGILKVNFTLKVREEDVKPLFMKAMELNCTIYCNK